MKNIIIILSNEFDENNNPNKETLLRSNYGFKLSKKDDLIISLGWDGGLGVKSISDRVKDYLISKFNLPEKNIISIPLSKDTVGDAFFSREFLFRENINFKKIKIVTNQWHMNRTKIIFNYIFNNDPRLSFFEVISKKPKKINEDSSLKSFYKTFDINETDFNKIKENLFINHPLYLKNE